MVKVIVQMKVVGPDDAVLPLFGTLDVSNVFALPNGTGPAETGKWTSHSRYLGRTLSGQYLLRNHQPGRSGPDPAGPVGWFVDSDDWTAPFLVLNNFDRPKGVGQLFDVPPDVPLRPTPDRLLRWFKI